MRGLGLDIEEWLEMTGVELVNGLRTWGISRVYSAHLPDHLCRRCISVSRRRTGGNGLLRHHPADRKDTTQHALITRHIKHAGLLRVYLGRFLRDSPS